MSTITVDTVKSSVAGVAPVIRDLNNVEVSQGCTAWVNFNGTGVVAIRDSFNVSGITDNGIGDYTVNFATPMTKVNYATTGSAQGNPTWSTANVGIIAPHSGFAQSTSSVRVLKGESGTGSVVPTDCAVVNIAIFGGK